MVAREAVRPVDRDRDPHPGLVKRQRVEDRLREHHLLARPRRLEVHDAPQRARQIAVARRLHPAPVEARPAPAERVRQRHHDAAAEEFPPLLRHDTERQEILAQLALLRDQLQERAVRVADPQRLDEVRVGDPTLDEVGLGVLPLAEAAVVVLDHPGKDLARVRQVRRAGEGRALDPRPRRQPRLLHQPLHVEPGTPRQRLERPAEAHLVVLRHEADHVAQRLRSQSSGKAPSPRRR